MMRHVVDEAPESYRTIRGIVQMAKYGTPCFAETQGGVASQPLQDFIRGGRRQGADSGVVGSAALSRNACVPVIPGTRRYGILRPAPGQISRVSPIGNRGPAVLLWPADDRVQAAL